MGHEKCGRGGRMRRRGRTKEYKFKQLSCQKFRVTIREGHHQFPLPLRFELWRAELVLFFSPSISLSLLLVLSIVIDLFQLHLSLCICSLVVLVVVQLDERLL